MLPAEHRLTDSESFRRASRRGKRAHARTVVTHSLVLSDHTMVVPRVGFTVAKSVGNAVTRNRVKRRLRHAVRSHLSSLAPATVLVVRAKPAAAEASYDDLSRDLARCLARTDR